MKLTFRWYGDNDPVTLEKISQIPQMSGIVSAVYDVAPGGVWSMESIGKIKNDAAKHGLAFEVVESVPVPEDIKFGKWHDIEVEDDVTTHVEYANGATGTFIVSTGEFPGTNRLEIAGDKGKLTLENGVMKWWQLQTSEREVCFSSKENSPAIPMEYTEFVPEEKETAHVGILQNFTDAVLYGEPLLAPGDDGIRELTISNAAYLSAWMGNAEIKLPFDQTAFDRLLHERAEMSVYHATENGVDDHSEEYSHRWQVQCNIGERRRLCNYLLQSRSLILKKRIPFDRR